MSEPNQDAKDFLAELDAEFGKKPRERQRGTRAQAKDSAALRALSNARGQLTRMDFDTFEEFEAYREMLIANEISKSIDWRPSWIPEARVTHCIRQHCDTCGNNTDFIGGEFIRFRSKRERAIILRRMEVVSDLWHYGYGGKPLPDLIEYHYQVTHRCPGCIEVERIAIEIWHGLIEPDHEQPMLPSLPRPVKPPLTGEQLKALVRRPWGERKAKSSAELDIEL